jgi:hypothetical protein
LDYCFPKDGAPIEGRNVRLVQVRLGSMFLQKAVEVRRIVEPRPCRTSLVAKVS